MKDYKAQFQDLVNAYIHREGIADLMEYINNSDFFEAPASTRFHGAEPGGLCQHSIAVGKHLMKLADVYVPGQYTKETLAIVALFHDLCKIRVYTLSTRNVKDESTGCWRKEPFYKFEEQDKYGGHGAKSVFIVMQFMSLSMEEASAINCHMGFAGESNIGSISDAYNAYPLAWLLHVADEAATYIDKQ